MKRIVSVIIICFVALSALGATGVFAQGTSDSSGQSSSSSGPDSMGQDCDPKKDIMLNLDIPFIGRCIKKKVTATAGETTYASVFPKLVGGMARIVMTAVVIIGFLGILSGAFMIAGNGAFGTKERGKKLIISIIAGFMLLGASGIILNLINPAFFGTGS